MCKYVYVYAYIYGYVYVYVYVDPHICECVSIYIHKHICVCVYIYIHKHTYIYIHIHIHTYINIFIRKTHTTYTRQSGIGITARGTTALGHKGLSSRFCCLGSPCRSRDLWGACIRGVEACIKGYFGVLRCLKVLARDPAVLALHAAQKTYECVYWGFFNVH